MVGKGGEDGLGMWWRVIGVGDNAGVSPDYRVRAKQRNLEFFWWRAQRIGLHALMPSCQLFGCYISQHFFNIARIQINLNNTLLIFLYIYHDMDQVIFCQG